MENRKAVPVCAEDERAIIEVLLRYGTAIDTRDWGLFRTCFSEDCETDYGTFGRWRGPREVTENMQQAHEQFVPTLHQMTNFTFASDGVQVRARTYVGALIITIAAGGPLPRAIGLFTRSDELRVGTA